MYNIFRTLILFTIPLKI